MKHIAGLLLLLVMGLSSCDFVRTSGPAVSEEGFSVDARFGRLILTNDSPEPVHYVAMEEGISALVDLYFEPTKWPSIAPGEQKRIPYGELMGYERGARQARVYWWTRGEYKQHIILDLR